MNNKNKVAPKKQINESMFQSFIDWFTQMWNDSSQFSDAYGTDSSTKGQLFQMAFYATCSIVGISSGILLKDKVKAFFSKAPKKIMAIGKAIKSSTSKADADQKLQALGVNMGGGRQQAPAMTNEAKQIKKVLTLLEAQVDKDTFKKRK